MSNIGLLQIIGGLALMIFAIWQLGVLGVGIALVLGGLYLIIKSTKDCIAEYKRYKKKRRPEVK